MKLRSKNIFLDTNIYEENNFFHSSNIQAIFHYSKIGVIKLYMTSISNMELIDRMEKGLIGVKNEHNKFVNFINKTRILKNLNEYERIEKSKLNVENSLLELTNKLSTIIRNSNIQIINADSVIIEEVFNHYYKKEPPFSNESKKFEFPDAFIIKTIDTWCNLNKKKMVFVTKDSDFLNYKSDSLIFKNDLSGLLSDITYDFDAKQKNQYIPFVQKTLKENENALIELIDSEIESLFSLDIGIDRVINIKREKIKFHDYKIISIRPKYAEVTYNVEFNTSFMFIPTVGDIEKSFFEDSIKPKIQSLKKIISCDLEVNLIQKNDIKLKWINSNQKVFINFEN